MCFKFVLIEFLLLIEITIFTFLKQNGYYKLLKIYGIDWNLLNVINFEVNK